MKTYYLVVNSQDTQEHISSPLSHWHTIKLSVVHWRTKSSACQALNSVGANSLPNPATEQDQEIKDWWQKQAAVIPSTCLLRNTDLNKLGQRHTSILSALPLKDKKILGAERGSLEGGSPADDRASRASSQHTLSHNIVPLFVNRGEGDFRSWGTERHEHQTISLYFHLATWQSQSVSQLLQSEDYIFIIVLKQ